MTGPYDKTMSGYDAGAIHAGVYQAATALAAAGASALSRAGLADDPLTTSLRESCGSYASMDLEAAIASAETHCDMVQICRIRLVRSTRQPAGTAMIVGPNAPIRINR